MTEDQQAVLDVLAKAGNETFVDYTAYCFSALMSETDLDRPRVRRACRALARKGYAICRHGLWTEDGEPYGSGYAITKSGSELFAGANAKGII